MEELWMILWRERDLLDALHDDLAATGRVSADGGGAGRPVGGPAVGAAGADAILATLRGVELLRAVVADDLAAGLGLPPGASLRELAADAPEPWAHLLGEQHHAIVARVGAIEGLETASQGEGEGEGEGQGQGDREGREAGTLAAGGVLVVDPPRWGAGPDDGAGGDLATVVDLHDHRRVRAVRTASCLQPSLVDFLR
ncbi:hypothetical protein ACOACO_15840 [Nocardioides sp. CPCC 205120]|uniref:hypothetical protein n=1 Tax=Nocardioides sp. CPCC 205120 TaxID=3406462 RepID=UPI003B502B12